MAQGLIRKYRAEDYPQVEEIFWLTSSRTVFANEAERCQFRQQYLDSYLSQLVLVALLNEQVMGYILGVSDTQAERAHWAPHMELFQEYYGTFPAHLHVNCHPMAQGRGLGRLLVMGLESELSSKGVRGLHLITSVSARNVSFYKQLGFLEVARKMRGDAALLMLAKNL